MSTITKKELIDRIAHGTETKQSSVKAMVQNFLEAILTELSKSNRIELCDFGVFELCEHRPRVAQNPKTFERVHVPAKRAGTFEAGRLNKQKMNDREANV
jgi:nucleoid DNA-binding protein